MKKIYTIFALLLITVAAHAQFGSGVKLPLAVGDTILNTTTVNKVFTATGGYSGTVVQAVLVSQTGTPAGYVKLYGSTDNGVTYNLLTTAADSLALGASSLSYTWRIAGPLPPYIKVQAKGNPGSTQNTLVKVWYVLRKYQNN